MPFNMAAAQSGVRTFILAITAQNLAINYNVEAEVVSQYGVAGTSPGDRVQLTISDGINLVASSTSVYAIDGNGLDPGATLAIDLGTSKVYGRGGTGGKGGGFAFAGSSGGAGGTAIRLGCPTEIIGSGQIIAGGGGGGGGGGDTVGTIESRVGGGGGGGGVPLGAGGDGGSAGGGNGDPGETATISVAGDGGAGAIANGGAGGDGGTGAAVNATGSVGADSGSQSGGSGGGPGDAIHTEGFDLTVAGGITVIGNQV